jgi:hypothetical protein
MTTAYIRSLEQAVTISQPSQSQSLRDKLLAWYHGLPAVSRDRRFSMSEIQSVNTQGRFISPVPLELGWRRKRVWSSTGQYHRYWEPPSNLE